MSENDLLGRFSATRVDDRRFYGSRLEQGDVARARAHSMPPSALVPQQARYAFHVRTTPVRFTSVRTCPTSEPHVFHASSHVSHIKTMRVPPQFVRVPRQNHTCLTQFAPVPHQNHTYLTPNSQLSQELPNVLQTGRLPTAPVVIQVEGSCRPNAALGGDQDQYIQLHPCKAHYSI